MTMRVGMTTFDTTDARALARWWADQVGGEIVSDHDGEFVVVAQADRRPPHLGFQRVAEPTPGKNRVHLDLEAPDRELEVERLQLAGAQVLGRHEEGGFAWVVMADPAGNHFCVSQQH